MRFANVGSFDRILRIILGAALLALPFVWGGIAPQAVAGIAAIVAGLVLIVTAIVKFCPIYGVLGLRTRPRD